GLLLDPLRRAETVIGYRATGIAVTGRPNSHVGRGKGRAATANPLAFTPPVVTEPPFTVTAPPRLPHTRLQLSPANSPQWCAACKTLNQRHKRNYPQNTARVLLIRGSEKIPIR